RRCNRSTGGLSVRDRFDRRGLGTDCDQQRFGNRIGAPGIASKVRRGGDAIDLFGNNASARRGNGSERAIIGRSTRRRGGDISLRAYERCAWRMRMLRTEWRGNLRIVECARRMVGRGRVQQRVYKQGDTRRQLSDPNDVSGGGALPFAAAMVE